MQQGSDGLNLEQALRILRRRVLLIGLCVVVVAAAAFGFSKRETKKYSATASLVFGANPLSQQVTGVQASSGGTSVAQQAANLELVRRGDMAARTATLIGDGLTEEKVIESLSIGGQGESSTVDVSATANSPKLAAQIATIYSRQFVEEQEINNRKLLHSALVIVDRELARLSSKQRLGEDGVSLQNRAQTLRLLSGLNYTNVKIAQEAVAPISPSSPKTSRNTALGALLGLLLGLGLTFVLESLDRRIKGPENLEEIYDVPLLGVVPESSTLARLARRRGRQVTALPAADIEAFNLIRARLRLFNIDHDLHTILIASSSPDDGKTTVARHLATAAAKMGSRVLLLEADLRRPTIARQLDIPPGPGLTDVLISALSLQEAVQLIDLDRPHSDGSMTHTLDILVSGAQVPNPGELIESYEMGALLEQAASAYDFVIIDTPPLGDVSDAFPLLTKVDGVVLVGRVAHSPRDAAERLHQALGGSGARVLGVIANGVRSGAPGPYAKARGDKGDKSSSAVTSTGDDPSSEGLASTAKV